MAATRSPRGAEILLRGLGYTETVAGRADLHAAIARLAGAAAAIDALDGDQLTTWSGIARLLEQLGAAGDAIDAIGVDGLATLARELGDQLITSYLRGRLPRLFRLACLLTLIDPAESQSASPLERTGDTVVRVPRAADRLRLDRARDLVTAPLETLGAVYLPDRLATAASAHAAAARVFPPLLRLASALGLFARVDLADTRPPDPTHAEPPDPEAGDHLDDNVVDPDEGTTDPPPAIADDPTAFFKRFRPRMIVALPTAAGSPATFGVSIVASSAQHPDHVAGFVIGLAGALALAETRGDWQLELTATGAVPAFVVGPGGVSLGPGAGVDVDAGVHLIVRRTATPGAPAFQLGAATGTRLELGTVVVRADVTLRRTGSAVALTIDTAPSAFVLAPGDGDGFLRRVLPREATLKLDAGLVLSSDGGLRLLGGIGLSTRSAGSFAIGPVTVAGPQLAVSSVGDALQLAITCDVAVALGPVRASLAGLGVALAARLPDGRPSLDASFIPPTGASIAIDSALVSGGGFLGREPASGRYLGALALRAGKFQIAGAGVLDTRMPDGRDGYSLAAIAAARFPAIQLGWGFTLDGLGVFLGINRTVDVDAMRTGLRDGALAALLASDDPVADAAAIIATLGRLFPPRDGRHLVGPTARIGWGTPRVLQADLALLLELPAPIRVLALGAVQVGLPTLEHRLVDLRLDVLGVLDLGRRLLAVDAALHHSTIVGYPLTGDMALRTGWGDDPHFLLSIGGFHPRFHPPAGFPALRRVALTIGDNPRLRLEAYLALTSSTIQLGARVDLTYHIAGLSISGHLHFDALLELRPFHLDAELEAKVAISYHGFNLASASLAFLLSGPRPWHARGKATIGILWWDVSVGFDVTWGNRTPPELPPPPDVAALLREALAAPSAWSAELPPGERSWLVLRDRPVSATLRVHPLGDLVVRQRVVPLGLSLTAFGTVPLPRALRFAIKRVQIARADAAVEPVQDVFAPAQFARLRSDERLAAPSFEVMTSGARLHAPITLDKAIRVAMDHDTVVDDPLAPRELPRPSSTSSLTLATFSAQHARAPRRRPPGAIRLRPPSFVLASTRDLAITATGAKLAGGHTTYAALREALREARRDGDPASTRLQIVPRAETANPKARVVVVREDDNLRNTDFVDTVTGAAMSREKFVEEIRANHYPGYTVRKMHGIDTPVSIPNAAVDDNLG